MIKHTQNILTAGLISLTLAAPLQANDFFNQTYVTAHIGRANSHVNVADVQQRVNRAGITNTTITSVNDRRIGFGLGLGYELNSNWAIELAYLDLEQVDIELTSTQTIKNLKNIHPESGDGITFSAVYKYPLDGNTDAILRLGVFNWDADYTTTTIGSDSLTGSDSDSGTDLYWGFGLKQKLTKNLSLSGEFQRFEFDQDKSQYVRLGLEWHCF